MQNRKSLSLQIAGATALAMLFGTSAFAESRHHSGTSSSSGGHSNRSSGSRSSGSRSSGSSVQRGGSASRSQSRSADRGSWQNGQTQRNTTREFSQRDNNTQRSIARDTQRSDWRGNSNQRNDSRYNNNQRSSQSSNQRSIANDRFRSVAGFRPGGRAPYAVHERVSSFGRVDRFERWHGGYRVWLGGGLYPIFVPFERWNLFPLRIGLNIRFGGFWDPLGYWSVYDYSPYDGYYNSGYGNVYGYNDGYNNDGYTSGAIRGTVESIDFRRGTMVINDDTSRQFVTITLPRDRRIDDIRAGDYVEFSGGWTRRGTFEAQRLDQWDEGRGDGRNDNRQNDDRRY
jgi:hypothetical protein